MSLPSIKPVSDKAVESIADAIFIETPVAVVEAYSNFGQELIELHTAKDVCAYARNRRDSEGYVHLAVQYPDMAGKLIRARIDLDPSKCNGHTVRISQRVGD